MVTVLSVEFGSNSEATWTLAPVTSRISLILEPPLPIKDPHCEAGTTSLSETPDEDFEEVEADDDFPLLSPKFQNNNCAQPFVLLYITKLQLFN